VCSNDALAGQQLGRGITVTANSGVHYSGGEAQLGPSQLPAFPSPAATNGYHYTNGGTVQLGQRAGPQQPVGYSAPVAAVPPTIRLAPRIESPGCGVNLNPGGRAGGRPSGLSGPGVGSMDSLNSTQDSVLSFGSTVSTGSYNSQASINNPLRSSLKKTKNKDTASMMSGASNASGKKSVRIALGEEQTAV